MSKATHICIEPTRGGAAPWQDQAAFGTNKEDLDRCTSPIGDKFVKQRLGLSGCPSEHRSTQVTKKFNALVMYMTSDVSSSSSDTPCSPYSTAPVGVETYHSCIPLLDDIQRHLHYFLHPPTATSFLWIDLHGVPRSTSVEEVDAFRSLWRALGLQEQDVLRMEKLRVCVSQPPPHTQPTDSSFISGESTRRNSSESCEFTVYGMQDMYDEDFNEEPDTAQLRTIAGVFAVGPAQNLPHHGTTHYVLMELATLMEETTPSSPAAAGGKRWLRRMQNLRSSVHGASSFSPRQEVADGVGFSSPLFVPSSQRRGTLWTEAPTRSHECLGEISEVDHIGRIANTVVVAFAGGCLTWCRDSEAEFDDAQFHDAPSALNERRSFSQVKDWGRLQKSVLSHVKRAGVRNTRGPMIGTPRFLQLLLSTVCYSYLPDTTTVLTEVDAIDSMLPMINPDEEGDQADALRRVQLLRRRLALHRRLLFQKLRLLDSLVSPTMRTLGGFIQHRDSMDDARSCLAAVVRSRGVFSQTKKSVGYNVIKDDIRCILMKLDTARSVLSNTTLLYTSKVSNMNSTCSTTVDFYMLLLQYITLLILPLTLVASQWGMNCVVPGLYVDGLGPFWIICGSMVVCAVALTYPMWAYSRGRLDLLS